MSSHIQSCIGFLHLSLGQEGIDRLAEAVTVIIRASQHLCVWFHNHVDGGFCVGIVHVKVSISDNVDHRILAVLELGVTIRLK